MRLQLGDVVKVSSTITGFGKFRGREGIVTSDCHTWDWYVTFDDDDRCPFYEKELRLVRRQ